MGGDYGKRGYMSFGAGAFEDETADPVAARESRSLCAAARDRRRAELALEDQYMGFDTGKWYSKPFGTFNTFKTDVGEQGTKHFSAPSRPRFYVQHHPGLERGRRMPPCLRRPTSFNPLRRRHQSSTS